MTDQQPPQSETVDELLALLADDRSRSLLRHLRDSPDADASLHHLADQVGDADEEQVRSHLHHSTLPRLADAGVVEYDHERNTVRYQGNETLEELHDAVTELETGPDARLQMESEARTDADAQ